MSNLTVEWTAHALERMNARGASREDVRQTIQGGRREPARHGRTSFRKVFPFQNEWNDVCYEKKEVEAVAVRKASGLSAP